MLNSRGDCREFERNFRCNPIWSNRHLIKPLWQGPRSKVTHQGNPVLGHLLEFRISINARSNASFVGPELGESTQYRWFYVDDPWKMNWSDARIFGTSQGAWLIDPIFCSESVDESILVLLTIPSHHIFTSADWLRFRDKTKPWKIPRVSHYYFA